MATGAAEMILQCVFDGCLSMQDMEIAEAIPMQLHLCTAQVKGCLLQYLFSTKQNFVSHETVMDMLFFVLNTIQSLLSIFSP